MTTTQAAIRTQELGPGKSMLLFMHPDMSEGSPFFDDDTIHPSYDAIDLVYEMDCEHLNTEDAEFEIIEPKQLPNADR